jgi:transcription elongation factor S-II
VSKSYHRTIRSHIALGDMDSKRITEHARSLNKAASQGDPASSILNILDELRKGVVATEDVLRTTKIGIYVNKLKQHKDTQVARTASELVSKWRNDVKKPSNAAASGSSTPVVKNGASSPVPKKEDAPNGTQLKVKPENRSAKADDVDTNITGDKTRDSCFRLLYDGLAHMSEDPVAHVVRVARSVEVAAYNLLQPATSDAYKSKMRSLYQNLKNKSNPGLRKRVLAGDISPEKFIKMSSDELKSEERRAEEEKLQKENMNKAMVPQEQKSISSSLQCGKCKQKKVSYSQAQTRSADEPMTTFCECTHCGNRVSTHAVLCEQLLTHLFIVEILIGQLSPWKYHAGSAIVMRHCRQATISRSHVSQNIEQLIELSAFYQYHYFVLLECFN